MKIKNYKLVSIAKQGLFALALTLFSNAFFAQTTYTFNYTGASQSVAVLAGSYSIQCWGANGGTSNGGKGGYSTGTINVTSPTTLHIYVGGAGTSQTSTGSGNALGGWNGGGNGSCYSSYGASGGGGGGSDVRTSQNTTYANRIIVAGGGGGGSTPGTYGYVAGNGGGASGTNGAAYGSYWIGQGGTQTAGGAGTTESNSVIGAGTLGVGGSHSSTAPSSGWAGCGGGGGYYGGSAGGAVHSSGGGGSGYIGGVSSATTAAFGQTGFVTNPVTNGNGLVLIKELCSINMVATGTNSNSAICSGNSVTLTTNAVSNYSWSTGATTSSIVVSPTATTLYSLSATSASACTSTAQLTITVNGAVPSLTVANTASATSGICPTKTVALTASGAANYVWLGGSTTVTNGVAFSPTITSGYTVTGYNACGTSTAATSVSIHPFPTVGAVASTPSLCSGLSLTLTATGTATGYVWNAGVTNGVGFSPSTTNTYVVIGTSALSCTASASTIVTVVTTPSLTPTANPISICIGSSSTLTATGATNYTWLPNNASTNSIVVSPTAVVNTYTVIKSNANCVDTKTINVFVNPLPTVFGIATPVLVCAGKPSTLSVGGALTYTWTGQSPTYTFTGASPVVSPTVANVYTVVGTDANGCKNSATVAVATDPNPTISIALSSSVICKGQSVSMTASGGINYTWTSTSGTVTTASFTDSPIAPTLYNVTADNSFSCFTTVSQIVLVNPTPTINIAVTKTLVCSGGPSTITASGANSYTWDASANNATTAATVVNPIATTVYTVQGMYSATQCQSTKTVEVKVFTPTITVTNPTNTCYGGNITLVASGANPNSYNWNTGSGFVNPFQTIAVTPTVFTIYTVSAVSGSNGVNCPSTQTTSIGIFYNPTITATPQRTLVCRGESVELYGNGGVSYSWSNSQTGSTITISPTSNTNFTVTGTDANGCVNTGTIQVKVSNCTGINELNGSADNGISVYPNPNNGTFNIRSEVSVKLNLVNELGQVIRSIELKASNNYKADISDLSAGVYFIVGDKNGAPINQKIIVTK